jgi:hypothetical protein
MYYVVLNRIVYGKKSRFEILLPGVSKRQQTPMGVAPTQEDENLPFSRCAVGWRGDRAKAENTTGGLNPDQQIGPADDMDPGMVLRAREAKCKQLASGCSISQKGQRDDSDPGNERAMRCHRYR